MNARLWLATGGAIALAMGIAVNAASADEPPARPSPTPSAEALPKFGEYVYVEQLPEVVGRVDAVTPEAALRAGVGGTVMVQALVGADGRVHDTKITKSIPLLDAAAIDCVRQWTFKPALSNQKPVAVWVAIPMKFPSRDGSTAEAPETQTPGMAPPARPPVPGTPAVPPNPSHEARISRVERPLRPHLPANAAPSAQRATVWVDALVAEDGRVRETRVASAASDLDAAALEAVRHATFRPAKQGGKATAVWVRVPVRFRK